MRAMAAAQEGPDARRDPSFLVATSARVATGARLPMAQEDRTRSFAAMAARDPMVQEAALQAAGNPEFQQALYSRTQAAGRAAHAAYCGSFWVYKTNLYVWNLRSPLCKCKAGPTHEWLDLFEKWNFIWVQAASVAYVIYMIMLVFHSIRFFPTGLMDLITKGLSQTMFVLLVLVLGHMGWYCVLFKNACCGGCGYATWAFIYLLAPTFHVGGLFKASEDSTLLRWAHLTSLGLMIIPSVFMFFALSKVKVATGFRCREFWDRCCSNQPSPSAPFEGGASEMTARPER